jgi:membrane-associated phospholipid phosphatase
LRRLGSDALAPLAPVDRLTLAFLAFLAAVATAAGVASALVPIAALAAAVIFAACCAERSRWHALVHDYLAIAIVAASFYLVGPLVPAANARRWDVELARIDAALFGAMPALWRGALGRPWWLTDAASLAYVSYYVIPVAIGVALHAAGRRREFESFVFVVVATFFVSYLGYFAMPALGPRVPPSLEAATLGGGATSEAVRWFLRSLETNQLDAFPSGHTAISLVVVGYGCRLLPRWRIPLVALLAGILFATVYLSLHYVIDLVAGAVVAAAMPGIAAVLWRLVGGGVA